MKNFRMYEALCHLFPDADPLTAWRLEQGPHTGFEIAITRWDMDAPRPTQEELDAVYIQLAEADAQREAARDVPVGEVDRLITQFPTVGWDILKLRGIE